MRTFLLFFVGLSCLAGGSSEGGIWGAWSSSVAGVSRLMKAVNPYDEATLLGSACAAVNNTRNNTVTAVCRFVNKCWSETDDLDKLRDVLICSVVASGAALVVVSPPLAYVYAWAGYTLSVSGGIVLFESADLFLCGLAVGVPLCMILQPTLVCACALGSVSLGVFL